jgi:hypothetical protein
MYVGNMPRIFTRGSSIRLSTFPGPLTLSAALYQQHKLQSLSISQRPTQHPSIAIEMAAVQSLLKPVFALVGWTFAMEGWMYATRLPAMTKYNVKTDPNFSKEKLNNQIPPHIRWKGAHFWPRLIPNRSLITTRSRQLRSSPRSTYTFLCSGFGACAVCQHFACCVDDGLYGYRG